MSDTPGEDAERELQQKLTGGLGMLQAMMGEAMRPPRFRYRIVAWHAVHDLAADGWQLVPMGPVTGWYEPSGKLGGDLGFVMSRQVSATDEAETLLEQAGKAYPFPYGQAAQS